MNRTKQNNVIKASVYPPTRKKISFVIVNEKLNTTKSFK